MSEEKSNPEVAEQVPQEEAQLQPQKSQELPQAKEEQPISIFLIFFSNIRCKNCTCWR